MKPGPYLRQPQLTGQPSSVRPDDFLEELPSLLSDAQRTLIAALQTREHGMTMRQLETQLSWPRSGIQEVLESLVRQRVVARLNTLVPSYIYRYGGVDLDVE